MADKPERRGLGRGLSALMADVPQASEDRSDAPTRKPDMMVPVDRIYANPDQPRRHFSRESLEELSSSIREKGIIQPLILRPNPRKAQAYEIVAGERRWRAAQMAQLHEVPALVRDFDDTEVLEIAIVENIQRADLNAMEEAAGYKQLMERYGHTQEKLSEALGKSRSHIANLLRLFQLPDEVQDMVRGGDLSAGHARALITTEDPLALARKVIEKGLSVRETEKLAAAPKKEKPAKQRPEAEKDADTKALEQDLAANLKMKVQIDHPAGQPDGQITIRYQTLEDLDRLCSLLSGGRG
jgi:ParB family chromosome partitioning protein